MTLSFPEALLQVEVRGIVACDVVRRLSRTKEGSERRELGKSRKRRGRNCASGTRG